MTRRHGAVLLLVLAWTWPTTLAFRLRVPDAMRFKTKAAPGGIMVKRTGPDVVSSDKQVDPDSPTVDIFHYGTNIMTKDGQLDPNPNGLGDMAGDMWDKIWDNAGAPDGGDACAEQVQKAKADALALAQAQQQQLGETPTGPNEATAKVESSGGGGGSPRGEHPEWHLLTMPQKLRHVAALAALLFVIFLVVMLLEAGIQALYRAAAKRRYMPMKAVLDASMRELAILGFLLGSGFVLMKSGALVSLDAALYDLYQDAQDKQLIYWMFEDVQLMVGVAVMVFICLIMVLVWISDSVSKTWARYERACKFPDDIVWDFALAVAEKKIASRMNCVTRVGIADDYSAMDFLVLRMEFVPFLLKKVESANPGGAKHKFFASKRDCDETTARFAHFNFGEYLSIQLGSSVSYVLKIPVTSWIVIEILMLLMMLPWLADPSTQIIVFLSFGYALLALLMVVHLDLRRIYGAVVRAAPSWRKVERLAASFEKADAAENKLEQLMSTMMQASVQPPKRLDPRYFETHVVDPKIRSCTSCGMLKGYGFTKPLHLLWWFGDRGPEVHLFLLRVCVACTAIYASMMVIVCPVAYREFGGSSGLWMILTIGLLPVVMVVAMLKTAITRYVLLSSIGAFRKDNVVHHVIERSQARMAMNVMRVFDWLILLQTKDVVKESQSLTAGDTMPGDAELVLRVFERIGTTVQTVDGAPVEVITQQDFASWYQKSKVLSDASIDKKVIESIFKGLDDTGDGHLNFKQFSRMFLAREQAELHVFGAAQQVVRNVFREKIQDDMLQVHDFKHLIVKELGAEISDAVLVELFEEVGFIIGTESGNLEQKVTVDGLAQLLVKYAPNYPSLKSSKAP